MGEAKKKREKELAREFSAGGVVFRKLKTPRPRQAKRGGQNSKFKILWLVAKSASSELYPKGFWRLPKGWLDDEGGGKKPGPLARGIRRASEEELQKAALKEVREEGGIKTKIISKLGTDRFFFTSSGKRILKFVTYYLMEWLDDLPEGPGFETEKAEWLLFDEAKDRLKYPGEKEILEKAKRILDSGKPSES